LGQDSRHPRSAVADWCRDRHLEPPSNERTDRIIGSAVRGFEEVFFAEIHDKLSEKARTRLDALIESETAVEDAHDAPDTTRSAFSLLKSDPGHIGLASVQREIAKLNRIRELDLPDGLWADTSPKLLESYRSRAATESIRELRRHSGPVRYTLLSAFCWQRRREITDGLVDLLIQVVHRLSVRAEKRITAAMIGELQRVDGKTALLFRIAEAALDNPDGVVREVLFPLVGESTLAALVKESQAGGPTFRRRIQTLVHRSYAHHYRRMLSLILATLVFQSNNKAHRPLIEALNWLRAHRDDRRKLILCTEVPIDGIVRPQLQEILVEDGPDGERINRIDYEICALQVLRERLRCKEIWVEGADHYRNPDEDLPVDFEANRAGYYGDLQQPRDPHQFIETPQQAMRNALGELDTDLPRNPKVRLRATGKKRIVLTPLDPQPEPSQLRLLKTEIRRRWPMTSLLDVLKETDLRVGFTDAFKTLATREVIDCETLQQRLLLCLYGLGTNAGLKRMAASNREVSYSDLHYVRRRFIEKSVLREAIRRVVNATFAARLGHIWGEGTTACASDSKKFGAWDQNLMTEWHTRYGGRGVMIYWHVERRAACIYS